MKLVMKFIKGFFLWVKDSTIEIMNQTFTLLGFFIAWLTLTGMARTIVGWAIVWSIIVWIVTLRIRNKKGD